MLVPSEDTELYLTPGIIAYIENLIELIEWQNHFTICPVGVQTPFGCSSPGPGGGGTGGGAGGSGGGGNGGGSGSGGGALGGQNPDYTPPDPPGGGMGGSGGGGTGVNTMAADDLNHERGHPAPDGPDNHLNGLPPRCKCQG